MIDVLRYKRMRGVINMSYDMSLPPDQEKLLTTYPF